MKLNSGQQAAASSRARRTIVKAGAGTGKTAACIGWVTSIILEGVQARKILMLTFTRKAAKEMMHRAVGLVGDMARGLTCGTYHSIAVMLIRREPETFGYGDKISLLDQSDAMGLMKAAARTLDIKKPSPPLSMISNAISSIRNRNRNVPVELAGMFGSASDAVAIAEVYEKLKKRGNMLDYDDLLVRLRDRLRDDPAYAARLRSWFPYCLCDEMQDNNSLQYDILEHLNPDHLLMVGDVNQSIYAFRSAEPALMLRYERENPDLNTIKLEDNYRSGQEILDLANEVIAGGDSPLVLKSATGKTSTVVARKLVDQGAEAYEVADGIDRLIRGGAKGNTICVLSRSSRTFTNLEIILRRRKQEYRKYGGLSISDSAEVRDYSSFVRLMANFKDRPALIRALTQFPGVGEESANRVADSDELFSSFPKKADAARTWIEAMRTMPFPEAMKYLLDKVVPLIQANYKNDNADTRIENLTEIVGECIDENMTLEEFVDSFITEPREKFHPETAITLSTIHSAKGLEWESVYVMGVGSEQMPHPRSVKPEEIEEERRLMYVALTRAKSLLVVTYPQLLNRDFQEASPFLPFDMEWEDHGEAPTSNARSLVDLLD